MAAEPSDALGRAQFSETRWSLILRAREDHDPRGMEALEILCRKYWPPVYAFLRRSGYSNHDAKDLCQGFFERLLTHSSFSGADPVKGRFRTYLLGALQHHLADSYARENRLKRGGGRE